MKIKLKLYFVFASGQPMPQVDLDHWSRDFLGLKKEFLKLRCASLLPISDNQSSSDNMAIYMENIFYIYFGYIFLSS